MERQALLHGRPKARLYPFGMERLYERIAAARERAGLTLEQVAEPFGITPQAVFQWEQLGGTKPSLQRLIQLSDVLGVSLDYLLRENVPLDGASARVQYDPKRHAPLLDKVAAGQWNDVVTPSELNGRTVLLELSSRPVGYAIALELDGESMAPDYRPGDIIIIDTGVEPLPGDAVVAIISHEQEATFKKYRPRGNGIIELAPINPDYPTLTISPENPGRILGTLMEFRRRSRRASRAA